MVPLQLLRVFCKVSRLTRVRCLFHQFASQFDPGSPVGAVSSPWSDQQASLDISSFISQTTSALLNCQLPLPLKHLSPVPAVFPWFNAAMGGAKLIIAKHVACQLTKHSPDSRKENTLSQLTGVGKGYCYILLPQLKPEGNVLSFQIAYCAHTTGIANLSVASRHSW